MQSKTSSAENTNKIILASAYCAPIEYFALIAQTAEEQIVIEQHETYPKQTWRNRCRILTSQGTLDLSISIKRPNGNHTLIRDVTIDTAENWLLKHWRAISSAYNASPFFLYYKDELSPIFLQQHKSLLHLNNTITSQLLKILKINKELVFTQEFIPPAEGTDLRYNLAPKRSPVFSNFPTYTQVFETNAFVPNLSILDLLFNLGPEAGDYLRKIS